MTFEFPIPLSRDDLTRKTGINQYVVDEVFPVRLLPAKLQECKSAFRSQGPVAILTVFDTFYSILKRFHEIEPDYKADAWGLLVKGISGHANNLAELLETNSYTETREQHLNTIKMTVYLLCQFIDMIEFDASKPSTVVISGKGRKKSQKKSADMGNMHWETERDRGVRAVLQLLRLNVHRLWDPPVMEEEFVNLVTNSCYKLLENPDICKDKSSSDSIFQLLGIMVKKHNHSLGCSLKFLQLMQHFEHIATPLAEAVEIFTKDLGVKSIAGDIMREIGNTDPKDLERDSSGTRAYAAFLTEVAERIPATALNNMMVLLPLLDEDSYTMRNCVLTMMGRMLVKILSKDDIDDKLKSVREDFLDNLEDHLHDIHAFVRSKVLQIWLYIVNEKALPLPRHHELLKLVIGRLHDKSSQVRRHAVQLISAMLRSNPFAAQFSGEELKANYEKEKAKLDEMAPKVQEPTPHETLRQELEAHWMDLVKDVRNSVMELLEQQTDSAEKEGEEDSVDTGDEPKDNISDEDTVDSVRKRIHDLLEGKEIKKALILLTCANETWPTEHLFNFKNPTQNAEEPETNDNEEKIKLYLEKLKHIFLGEVAEMPSAEPSQADQDLLNKISQQQVVVQYLKDSSTFVGQIEKAVPVVCQLLGSQNNTDVMEAIEFFVTSFEFGVTNAMMGIRRMLVLIWSKESNIKEAVVAAYKRLYLNPQGNNARAKALAIANNLTALTCTATIGDLTSLEELVCEFVRSGELDNNVIQILWERYALKIPNTTASESRGAIILLSMAAGADPDIVRSNISVLVKEGLGERADTDFLLVRDTCAALLKITGTKKRKAGELEEPFRLAKDHEMFSRLDTIIVNGVTRLASMYWTPMAEQAINVIYKLAENPDVICQNILKKISTIVMSQHAVETETAEKEANINKEGENTPDKEDDQQKDEGEKIVNNGDSQPEPSQSQEEAVGPQCPSGILARLLSIVGHIAFKHLYHLDVSINNELKRRESIQEEKKEGKKKEKKKKSKDKGTVDELTAEEEMGLAGASADDAEAEYIRALTEKEIVTGSNLLAKYAPLLVAVCSNQQKYPDQELRAAASLSLAKFMLVSSEFCEAHLQLLFTVLEKSSFPTVRANTIIALGDLTFRFPNLIEPWTPNLYARLRDPSRQVRKNTLQVLTHLIINDMVKVKGQISEMAACIMDSDERIAALAKLFFHELAKKGNAVYNIMPDMVSRLSDPEVGVKEDAFRTILKYLFSFIQKDKQCESLVEKLCHRFRATTCERQWRDLAFCLSMMNYSERGIRKLQDNFACFADKLGEEDVYNSFVHLLNGAKSFAKPETKTTIEEIENRIEQCHSKGVDDNEAIAKASMASKAAKTRKGKTPHKTPAGRKRGKRVKRSEDSDEECSEGDDFQPARRGTRKPVKVSFESDDDSEGELFKIDNQKEEEEEEDQGLKMTDSSPLFAVRKRSKKSVSCRARSPVPDPTPVSSRTGRRKPSARH